VINSSNALRKEKFGLTAAKVGPIKRPVLLALGCFILGIVSAIFVPKLILLGANRAILPEQRAEISRVTSPDGVVDAKCSRPNYVNRAVRTDGAQVSPREIHSSVVSTQLT
jgi:hypothetical protein